MLSSVRLLDCTLREAPLDDLMWGDMSIQKIIHGLEMSNVNIIEVGFLKNNPYKFGSTSFQRAEEIEPYLKNKNPKIMYVALVDYGRYDLENLCKYNGRSIDGIRICFKHQEINSVLDYASEIRAKGYQVSIQHVDTMGYKDEEIISFIKEVNEFKPFSYSVVDTFGAMYEDDMLWLTRMADKYLNREIFLGFHGHNNLMMADANAQRFIQEIGTHRGVIVDSSLYGCGRSAGNAHTELVAQYLNRKFDTDYDINEILDLIDTVIAAAKEKTSWGYSIPYFIAGMHNAHTFNVNQLLKRHNLKSKDLRGIIEKLDDVQKKKYDFTLLEKLYIEYFDKPIDDTFTIKELSKVFAKRNILLLAPGKTIIDNVKIIEEFIKKHQPIVIGVNNLIEGYKLDYIFYSGTIRYQNLQYQDYIAAGKPRLIVSSNVTTQNSKDEIRVDYLSLIKFGWINLDSSVILLLRLLVKCGVTNCFAAGIDGYKQFGQAFYKNELDTGLSENDRIEHTNDNISMMRDLKNTHPEFHVHFLTDSIYEDILK